MAESTYTNLQEQVPKAQEVAIRFSWDDLEIIKTQETDDWERSEILWDLFIIVDSARGEEGRPGKTSLVQRLLGRPFEEAVRHTFVYGEEDFSTKPTDTNEHKYRRYCNMNGTDFWLEVPNEIDSLVKLTNATYTDDNNEHLSARKVYFEKAQQRNHKLEPKLLQEPETTLNVRIRDTGEYLYSNSFESAGSPRYGEYFRFWRRRNAFTPIFASLVVFDARNYRSFALARQHCKMINRFESDSQIWALILCGNKQDLVDPNNEEAIKVKKEAEEFSRDSKIPVCFISAKTSSDLEIKKLFSSLISNLFTATECFHMNQIPSYPLPEDPNKPNPSQLQAKVSGKHHKNCLLC